MGGNDLELGALVAANRLVEAALVVVTGLSEGASSLVGVGLANEHTWDGVVRVAWVGDDVHVRQDGWDGSMATLWQDAACLEAAHVRTGAGCGEAWCLSFLVAGDSEAVVVGILAAAELEFGDLPVVVFGGFCDWCGESWGKESREGGCDGEVLHFCLRWFGLKLRLFK